MFLESTAMVPLINDGPAYLAIVSITLTFILNMFKSYVPIIGKKHDDAECKRTLELLQKDFAEFKITSAKQKERLLKETQVYREKLLKLEGWLAAMKLEFEAKGYGKVFQFFDQIEIKS